MRHIGGKLLPGEQKIDLYGTPTLIMHGDTLCTDDKSYQRLRSLLRLKLVQKIYLALSPKKRSKKANQVRQRTQKSTQHKDYSILDVNQKTVEKVLKSRGVSLLIHGHTHRPAEHEFMLQGNPAKRIVLGDWGDNYSYMCIDENGTELFY